MSYDPTKEPRRRFVIHARPDKHWVAIALGVAAGAIGCSGHDGWGWCLVLCAMIEM